MKTDSLELDLVAISKDGKVFVKEKEKYSSKLRQYTLRFDVPEEESFNEDWKVFKTVPTLAEHFIRGCGIIIKYKLKDGFTPTDKTPEFMVKNAFRCCDDGCENSEIKGLYEPVYRKKPDEWKIVNMTIDVIDSNCEPLIETKYKYVVDFPHYINKHMIIRHTMPCYIEGDDAYEYIRNAVKKNIPYCCVITSDHDFHFEVKTTVPYIDDPLKRERKTVIQISKQGYTYPGKVHDVRADNYYELEKKMDAIIKDHLDRMKTKIVVCPECQGKGWKVEE